MSIVHSPTAGLAMVPLLAAEDKHPQDRRLPPMTAAERIVARHWPPYPHSGLPQGVTDTVAAYAWVNHGRWLVSCPWCPSAQNASRQDHRFFCTECANRAAGGQWITVVWPDNAGEIERLLGRRTDRAQRNWTPGETVEGLAAENREHGVFA
jgi:hypothetical protein